MNYVLDSNGYPVTHLYGIGGDHSIITDHSPYFFVQFNNKINKIIGLQLLRNNGFNRVEAVQRFEPIGYQTQPKLMFKVFTKSPKDVREAREKAAKIPNVFKLYESDVLYQNRVAIDKGLGGFCCTNGETADIPMKYLGFDIEVLVKEDGSFPKASEDPIIIISMSFSPSYDGMSTMLLHSGTEKDILSSFISIINDYNPDIISGYNILEFDFPYIEERCNKNGLRLNIGRDKKAAYIRGSSIGHNEVIVTGRVIIDLLPIIKKDYNLSQYNLKTVAKLVGLDKLDVSALEMRKAWISGDKALIEQSLDYARRDAELVMKLLLDLKITDKYAALSKASGALLQDVINGSQTVLIESLLMREYYKVNRVINTKPQYSESEDEEEGYEGAVVLEPSVGLFEQIMTMDYVSLYSSIMRGWNICPTTILKKDDDLSCNTAPNGARFYNGERGLVPRILDELFEERVKYKRLMKAATNDIDRNTYDMRQYSFKILLNSMYGYFGYKRSRLYNVDIASAVTAVGRKNLELTKETIESMQFGDVKAKTIGGDTDSCFILLQNDEVDYNRAKEIADLISAEMAKKLPPPMAIAFEAYGTRGIILGKKRYSICNIDQDGKTKIKMRGIEVRRRDWADYVTESLSEVLNIILLEGDIEKAMVYANQRIKRIQDVANLNDDPELMEKLLLTRKLTKSIEQYDAKQVHIEAIQRAMTRGDNEYKIGDRIPYYITNGQSKSISDNSEIASYVLKNNIPIDKRYYIEVQLKPPLDRIFDTLGYDMVKMKKKLKQASLFSF